MLKNGLKSGEYDFDEERRLLESELATVRKQMENNPEVSNILFDYTGNSPLL
jgi:hypothetical protein